MVTIDDWRHGEHYPVLVIDDWINWFVFYDLQVRAEVAVPLQNNIYS